MASSAAGFLAFLAICFLCAFAGFAGAMLSVAAGAAPAAGAVVSVWAIAARGAKTIAALIPIAVSVYIILHSPCCSTLGRWRARDALLQMNWH